MKELLDKIPFPGDKPDEWQAATLPPEYHGITAKPGEAWFVDGGNAAILEAPHFSLQKLRAIAVHYPDKIVKQREGYCLITRTDSGWLLEGDSRDTSQGELQDAITFARQQLEHSVAKECSGLVVLDGDIAPAGTIALQKSITILTKNHFPLSSVLTKPGPWYAKLGKVFAVKLDSRARHVFLVRNASPEQLSVLAGYSGDALFPGYPQGLVLADRLARVSKEEAESLRIQAKSKMKALKQLRQAEASTDSHSILDSMG